MAVFPNRFPSRQGKIINKTRLSKLFLAILKHRTSPRDWLNLVVIVFISVFKTDNPKQQQKECFSKKLTKLPVHVWSYCACFTNAGKVVFYVKFYLKPLLIISYYWSSVSYLCSIFVFSYFSSLCSVCMAPLPLLPVFMHGTWWEELEPPSCHSSRLQFD